MCVLWKAQSSDPSRFGVGSCYLLKPFPIRVAVVPCYQCQGCSISLRFSSCTDCSRSEHSSIQLTVLCTEVDSRCLGRSVRALQRTGQADGLQNPSGETLFSDIFPRVLWKLLLVYFTEGTIAVKWLGSCTCHWYDESIQLFATGWCQKVLLKACLRPKVIFRCHFQGSTHQHVVRDPSV